MVTRAVASKSRLFRLRAQIGCPTFSILLATAVLSCVHLQLLSIIHAPKNTFSCFPGAFRAYKPFLTGKKYKTRLARFEPTSYMLPVLRLSHYNTAKDIVEMLLMFSYHTFRFN